MNIKVKKIVFYAVVFVTIIIVVALLLRYAAIPCALVAAGIWRLYDRDKAQKENARAAKAAQQDALAFSAQWAAFYAAIKFADIEPYKQPQTADDLMTMPAFITNNGITLMQFKLVKLGQNRKPDKQSCARLQKLMQGQINTMLVNGQVPNIPAQSCYYQDSTGYRWPIIALVAVRDEPLYYILQVALVIDEYTVQHLRAMWYNRQTPSKSPTADPEF